MRSGPTVTDFLTVLTSNGVVSQNTVFTRKKKNFSKDSHMDVFVFPYSFTV